MKKIGREKFAVATKQWIGVGFYSRSRVEHWGRNGSLGMKKLPAQKIINKYLQIHGGDLTPIRVVK
jgi:hypothetical protein